MANGVVPTSYPDVKPESLRFHIVANAMSNRAIWIHGNSGIGKSQLVYRMVADPDLKECAWGRFLKAKGLSEMDYLEAWRWWAVAYRPDLRSLAVAMDTALVLACAWRRIVESRGFAATGESDAAVRCAAWNYFALRNGQECADGGAVPQGYPELQEFPDLEMVHLVLPQHESEDFIGVPRHRPAYGSQDADDMVTAWAPVEVFRRGVPVMLFLDEVSAADTRIQKVLLQVVQERRIANVELAKGTVVVLAGNVAEDRAGLRSVVFTLGNRCAHVRLRLSAESWLQWAEAEGLPGIFRAWVRERRESGLHGYDSRDPSLAQLTSRSLEGAARGYEAGLVLGQRWGLGGEELDSQIEKLICSNVGNGKGEDLVAFIRLSKHLPTWDEIVENPSGARLPGGGNTVSMIYYMTGMMLDHILDISFEKDLPSVFIYAERMFKANPSVVDAAAWMCSEIVRKMKTPDPKMRAHALAALKALSTHSKSLAEKCQTLLHKAAV